MKYAIFKHKNTIIVVAEFRTRRFEIVFENGEFSEIWTFDHLTFNNLIDSFKEFDFKQVKKFTVRQNNEKNI